MGQIRSLNSGTHVLNQTSLTERIDIDPSATLSEKNFTLSALSCTPST